MGGEIGRIWHAGKTKISENGRRKEAAAAGDSGYGRSVERAENERENGTIWTGKCGKNEALDRKIVH